MLIYKIETIPKKKDYEITYRGITVKSPCLFYIGQTQRFLNLKQMKFHNYNGSGTLLKKAIEIYSLEYFTIKILNNYKSPYELNLAEDRFIINEKALFHEKLGGLNLAIKTGNRQNEYHGGWIPRGYTGVFIRYHENKLPMYIVECKDGKKHGKFIEYYSNGIKRLYSEWKDGNLHGDYLLWDENDNFKCDGEVINDKHNGKYIRWDENGDKRYEVEYTHKKKFFVDIIFKSYQSPRKIFFPNISMNGIPDYIFVDELRMTCNICTL